MSKRKIIALVVIGFLIIFTVILAIALGYYDLQKNLNENINLNINAPGIEDLTVYGSGIINMNISAMSMLGTDENTVAYESNQGFVYQIKNNLGDTLETCTYDYVWTWDESSDKLEALTDENNIAYNIINEFTITAPFTTIASGINIVDSTTGEVQIPYYVSGGSLSTTLGSGTSSASDLSFESIPIIVRFRSLSDYDQSSRLNKSYYGTLSIENISCSSGNSSSYAGDQEISVSDFITITGTTVSNPNYRTNLNSSYYIVSGTGSETRPYVIN